MMQNNRQCSPTPRPWIGLMFSAGFLLRHPKLVFVSTVLIVCTGILTWFGMHESLLFLDSLTGHFFSTQPDIQGFWHWPALVGWKILSWFFLIITRVIAFYLAFLVAYCITSPGYVFLSYLAGNRFTGKAREGEASMTLSGIMIDLWEGVKIGLIGIFATILAFLVNFIPFIGQALAFLIYVFYSTLMFIDFPSSRYRWHLGQKIGWVYRNRNASFMLGLLPAAITMVPVLNLFFMALLFPLFTIHTTLNYLVIEGRQG